MSSHLSRSLSIRHFRCFIEVANSGSFTVAARRLFVTQSSLTTTIQQFEDLVGMKLFDRTTRRVVMTPEAVRFKSQAEKVVREFDASVTDLASFSEGQQGDLNIALAPSLLHMFLARAAMRFRAEYPGVTLTIRDASAQQVEQLVADGELDFAVAAKFRGIDDLEYTPLVEDTFGVICRADYRVPARRGTVRLDALSAADHVAFTTDMGIGRFMRTEAPSPSLLQEASIEVSSFTSLLAVLNEGGCFAIVPALATTIAGFETLRFYELSDPVLTRQSFLVTRRLRRLSPSARRFLEKVSEAIIERKLPAGVTSLVDAQSLRGSFEPRLA
jgi:DNA-binding transcriptional LysR family regulator